MIQIHLLKRDSIFLRLVQSPIHFCLNCNRVFGDLIVEIDLVNRKDNVFALSVLPYDELSRKLVHKFDVDSGFPHVESLVGLHFENQFLLQKCLTSVFGYLNPVHIRTCIPRICGYKRGFINSFFRTDKNVRLDFKLGANRLSHLFHTRSEEERHQEHSRSKEYFPV